MIVVSYVPCKPAAHKEATRLIFAPADPGGTVYVPLLDGVLDHAETIVELPSFIQPWEPIPFSPQVFWCVVFSDIEKLTLLPGCMKDGGGV